MKAIPEAVLWVLKTLQNQDKEAYLVGGCIRDMLMQREVHDYDITTSALPEEIISIFKNETCSVVPTGQMHGTITVIKDHQEIEITTFRKETGYGNHRHPDQVSYTSDLLEDLKRRDFTMNAIAYTPSTGLIDPFHGSTDIQNKLIRCVGNAEERLQEDALRILRALRFSCTLQFRMDSALTTAIQKAAPTLTFISKERIRSEFDKILCSEQKDILSLLHKHQVLSWIIPGYERLFHEQKTPWHCYDIFRHTDVALNYEIGAPITSRLALVFHDFGKPDCEVFDEKGVAHYYQHALLSETLAVNYMKALRYDKKTIKRTALLIRYHDYYVKPKRKILRKFLALYDGDFDVAQQALDIQLADDYAKNPEKVKEQITWLHESKLLLNQMKEEADVIQKKDLAINGRDIISLGFQGSTIGKCLDDLLLCVLEDPELNNKTILMKLAQELQKTYKKQK